jgi:hypothetical protein
MDEFLPASAYRSNGARALIQSALGYGAAARQSAHLALEAAGARHSEKKSVSVEWHLIYS